MTSRNSIVPLLVILTLCFGVAFLGQQATMQGMMGWYQSLEKPAWNPPAWIFAPVWTLLYLMMGIAAWMVWRSDDPRKKGALILFGIQLALNAAWSWIFFASRNPQAAFIEIVVFWVAILLTMIAFHRVNRAAMIILFPYLVWVMFAATLNYTIWKLNPSPNDPNVLIVEPNS